MRNPWARRIASLLALLFASAAATSGCGSSTPKPLHVVLIVVDTLRADHLSTYGYRRPTSPELDKLAKEGVVFENAVSQGSWTVPSMVSMMTGAYIAEELVRIPKDQTTLAQVFQTAGYATGAFIYNDVIDVDSGFDAGFDLFDFKDPPYSPIDKIANWIAANQGKPSFTYIHLNEAHDPYDPPGEFDRFVNEKDSVIATRLDYYRQVTRELKLANFDRSVQQINAEIGGYDDDMRYSDAHIGQILAALRASGEWQQTAIVIAADHGEGLWTRPLPMFGPRLNAKLKGDAPSLVNSLQMTHGTLVNTELVHVPLIFVASGMPRGVRAQPWVENVDIGPTLLELCDLPRPPGFQGQSLLPMWSEPEAVAHQKRGSFSHTRFASSFIDQNSYQLILPTPLGECQFDMRPELFDLHADPEARVNLAESRPQVVEGLKLEIVRRMKIGLSDYQVPTKGQMAKFGGIGYVDAEIIDKFAAIFAEESVDDLLKELSDPKIVNCLVRYNIARALLPRTFSGEQKAALTKLRDGELSNTVRGALDAALAGK